MMGTGPSSPGRWWKRVVWLTVIWAASVAALAVVAYVLRIVMSAVGMTV